MESIEYSTTLKDGETKYAMFRGRDYLRGDDTLLFNTREDCVKYWTHYGFKIQPEDSKLQAYWLWYVQEVIE